LVERRSRRKRSGVRWDEEDDDDDDDEEDEEDGGEDEGRSALAGASSGMMVELVKQVHLQKDVGAAWGRARV
jgi:hypothetical protein